jgi:hypothetical protein
VAPNSRSSISVLAAEAVLAAALVASSPRLLELYRSRAEHRPHDPPPGADLAGVGEVAFELAEDAALLGGEAHAGTSFQAFSALRMASVWRSIGTRASRSRYLPRLQIALDLGHAGLDLGERQECSG